MTIISLCKGRTKMTNNVQNVWKQNVYQVGATTNPIYINTTDTIGVVSSANYLAPQIAAGLVINAGDLVFVSYSGGAGLFVPSNASSVGPVTLASPGSDIIPFNFTITAAQFNGMYAAPVLVLPAPGTGLIALPSLMVLNMQYNSAAYTAGGPVALQWGNTVHGGGLLATNTEQAADFEFGANTLFQFGAAVGNGSYLIKSSVLNTGLYLSNSGAPFTTGNSPFVGTLWFRTVAA